MSENGLSIKGTLPKLQGSIVFSSEEIIAAVKKSDMSLIDTTILVTIITRITDIGITNTEKLLTTVYEKLSDNPDLLNKFIDILKSINQSCQ